MIDLVVLKINVVNVMMVVIFGNFNDIVVGQDVIVIGLLMGFEYVNMVIKGIIFVIKWMVKVSDSLVVMIVI